MFKKVVSLLLISVCLLANQADKAEQFIYNIINLIKQKEYEKAIIYCQTDSHINRGNATTTVALFLIDGGFGIEKDIKKGHELLKKAIELNNAGAMYELGLSYYNGLSIAKDEEKGLYYIHKAAELHNKKAVYFLGLTYIQKNPKLAFKYLSEAASQGYHPGMYNLSVMYAEGTGVLKNMKKAKYWISKSYDLGNKDAPKAWNHFELWKY